MRIAIAALVLSLALPASAVTITDASSFWSSPQIFIEASDGVTTTADQVFDRASSTAVGDVFLEETGTIGTIDPLRVFSGHVREGLADLSWTGGVGSVSHLPTSILFDNLEIEISGPQVGLVSASGNPFSNETASGGVFRASGSVLFGNESIPFSMSTGSLTVRMSSQIENGRIVIRWYSFLDSLRNPLFTFTRNGVTYKGLWFGANDTLIPEPSTALLLGLGLAGMSFRLRRSERHRQSHSGLWSRSAFVKRPSPDGV